MEKSKESKALRLTFQKEVVERHACITSSIFITNTGLEIMSGIMIEGVMKRGQLLIYLFMKCMLNKKLSETEWTTNKM